MADDVLDDEDEEELDNSELIRLLVDPDEELFDDPEFSCCSNVCNAVDDNPETLMAHAPCPFFAKTEASHVPTPTY